MEYQAILLLLVILITYLYRYIKKFSVYKYILVSYNLNNDKIYSNDYR